MFSKSIKFSFKLLLLFLIIVIGCLLRILWVGTAPGGLNRDEAALAYNAYLLSNAGRDEWGKQWPLALESFGDYKLAGYPLLLLPIMKLLPSAWVDDPLVRFPSILAGTTLIFLSYLFARRLHLSEWLSLGFSLMIATTPIFIFYSRFAYEASVALTLLVGSLVLLTSQQSGKVITWLNTSVGLLLFGFALITYNTPLLLTPIIVLLLVYLRGWKKWRSSAVISLTILVLSFIFYIQISPLISQKANITIFSDPTIEAAYPEYRHSFSGVWQTLLGNKISYWGMLVGSRLVRSFSPAFLALRGGSHPWHSLINYGHLYLPQYIVLITCLITVSLLYCYRLLSKWKFAILPTLMLLLFCLLSLLPAIVTVDAPHATRSLFAIYLFILAGMVAFGDLMQMIVKTYHFKSMIRLGTGLFLATQVLLAGRYLYHIQTRQASQLAPTVYAGLPGFLQTLPKDVTNFTVLDEYGYHYILFAWYDHVTPQEFSKTIERLPRDNIGFSYGSRVGRYSFKKNVTSADNVIEYSNGQWRYEPTK